MRISHNYYSGIGRANLKAKPKARPNPKRNVHFSTDGFSKTS